MFWKRWMTMDIKVRNKASVAVAFFSESLQDLIDEHIAYKIFALSR